MKHALSVRLGEATFARGLERDPRDYARDVCFSQLFKAQVERTPHAIAAVCADEQLSYQH